MAKCGIDRIDRLFAGDAAVAPLKSGDPEREAVGVAQLLLAGHGYAAMPSPLAATYGTYGPATTAAMRDFRARHGLPVGDDVDSPAFAALVREPAADPRASRGYLTLALDFAYSGMTKVLSLVAQMEGAGRFAALNANTDRAGLSFGIIQWAQKPGRLGEILAAFRSESPAKFIDIFGGGDAAQADGLLAHTRLANGGVDKQTGDTTDHAYNLVAEPWLGRFKAAAIDRLLQAVQVRTALRAFMTSYAAIHGAAPELVSERSLAFMMDLANQHGDGGAWSIYAAVRQAGMSERQLLAAMAEESVRRIQSQFNRNDFTDGARRRRESFLNTALLADTPFQAA